MIHYCSNLFITALFDNAISTDPTSDVLPIWLATKCNDAKRFETLRSDICVETGDPVSTIPDCAGIVNVVGSAALVNMFVYPEGIVTVYELLGSGFTIALPFE
jgi:hypothetical protein